MAAVVQLVCSQAWPAANNLCCLYAAPAGDHLLLAALLRQLCPCLPAAKQAQAEADLLLSSEAEAKQKELERQRKADAAKAKKARKKV